MFFLRGYTPLHPLTPHQLGNSAPRNSKGDRKLDLKWPLARVNSFRWAWDHGVPYPPPNSAPRKIWKGRGPEIEPQTASSKGEFAQMGVGLGGSLTPPTRHREMDVLGVGVGTANGRIEKNITRGRLRRGVRGILVFESV